MGRHMRTDVPETTERFISDWHFPTDFKEKGEIYKMTELIEQGILSPFQMILQFGL